MTAQTLVWRQMLDLQSRLNTYIHPHWAQQQFHWPRAVGRELIEMSERVGWKWWKAPPAENKVQQQIEIVDAIHFMLSWLLNERVNQQGGGACSETALDELAVIMNERWNQGPLSLPADMLTCMELGLAHTLNGNPWTDVMDVVVELARRYDLSFDEMARQYLSKNALNLFRNRNGYLQPGAYNKNGWVHPQTKENVEDNVVLEYVMDKLVAEKTPSDELFDAVYTHLEGFYPAGLLSDD